MEACLHYFFHGHGVAVRGPCNVGIQENPSWSWRMPLLSVVGWPSSSPSAITILENAAKNRALTLRVGKGIEAVLGEGEGEAESEDEKHIKELSCVMKFGGSSVASAERIREIAQLILGFPEENPIVVLSAMGKTTNNLLLAGEKAVSCGVSNASEIQELSFIKRLHLRTVDELGVDRSVISAHLEELEQLLKGIAMMKELTLRTRDYLVSFGECMSTRIFAAYLNKIGVKARQSFKIFPDIIRLHNLLQYDAFDIGFITTDDFTNADILEATYPAVAKRLYGDWIADPAIPVVTGFLGKGWKSCAITTLGRGGSDLTATTIGKALGLREIQVWKDVDGVLTCDPSIYPKAEPVPNLTFDEAAELAYFGAQVLHPQSMRPAREGDIPVRVKNSYNPKAPGTLITRTRDMTEAVLTSIVLKRNVTMLDIVSTRMLGQVGFLAKVFSIFEDLGISVDVVATSEVSLSLTLDPAKLWSRDLIQQELDNVEEELEKIALVNLLQHRSIISLIGNVQRSSLILEKAFHVLRTNDVNVQMISQGASKVNISLIVNDNEAERCIEALHQTFFESGDLSKIILDCGSENGSAAPFSSFD
ncbi:Aspartate kinase, monofunctional class [Parasponia andersonii]|uniref:aspartate kinase n=1 Tax=Parasponia andersonii TaxID=3476 RepID=A0A2P5BSY9_PARAD|nr:Aspartate kinase, monofunctional class [Parasponia andersonii]